MERIDGIYRGFEFGKNQILWRNGTRMDAERIYRLMLKPKKPCGFAREETRLTHRLERAGVLK